jgi:hypothetical protein
MSVTYRQPTFINPLPRIFKAIGKGFVAVLMGIIAFGESAGRARAARELANMGRYEEAKSLILREDQKNG